MKRLTVNLIFLLTWAGDVLAVVPDIQSFSSTGGNTQNKDNDQDIMYLIDQGDALSFAVEVDQPVSYEWAVNKSTEAGRVVTVPATTDTFNWTVPEEKGI